MEVLAQYKHMPQLVEELYSYTRQQANVGATKPMRIIPPY